MKAFLLEAKFILIFLVIVTAISGFSNFNFESANQLALRPLDLKSKIELSEGNWSQRAPASIAETQPLILEKDFFCNHSIEDKNSEVIKPMVMLSFKLCKDLKSIETISVVNQTNGFKAQVFKAENFKFKTDYIQLNKGSNKIFVEVILKDGQKNVDSLEILSGS